MQFSSTLRKAFSTFGSAGGSGLYGPVVALSLSLGTAVFGLSPVAAEPSTWLDQFGSSNPERATAVGAGTNAVYVAGWIDRGELDGTKSSGGADAYVRAYDDAGLLRWMHQFGTGLADHALAVTAVDDGCLVAGSTMGSLGGNNAGSWDGFVQRRNANGDVVWTMQLGATGADEITSMAVDGSDIYVAGWTDSPYPFLTEVRHSGLTTVSAQTAVSRSAFLVRLDANGSVVWSRQFGTVAFDQAFAVDVFNGGVYVAGRVGAALDGQTHYGSADAFVIRFDTDGNQIWSRQFGASSSDIAYALAADDGGVYVAGTTPTTLPGQVSFGNRDAFVRKYNHSGDEVWTRQIGGRGWEEAYGIGTDASGVYLAGRTDQGLDGQPPSAGRDAFMVKMDADGVELAVDQMGSSSTDENTAMAVSPLGAYVAGWSMGSMPGATSSGDRDAYIARYEVPEAPQPQVTSMTLDIRPGDCPKSINVRWMEDRPGRSSVRPNGVLPVALVAPAGIDVSEIDPASCRLEDLAPLRWSYEDVSSPRTGSDCECQIAASDGVTDLAMKFSTAEVVEMLVARNETGPHSLTLTGTLWDGTPFEAGTCVSLHNDENVVRASAFPNPFNPTTVIEYSIGRDLPAVISIYDISGRLIERLEQPTRPAGVHHVTWKASGLASGVYFYRVQAGGSIATGRVTMVK